MRLIRARKLLAIPLLPDHRPSLHHPPRRREENTRSPRPRHKRNANPRHDLKQVVRASDPVEAEALRDSPRRGATGTEVAQDDVGVEVCNLAIDVEHDAGVDDSALGARQCAERHAGGAAGGEDEVGDVQPGEDPVVGAVAQDVDGGHGSGGEFVDENSLELALDEVE